MPEKTRGSRMKRPVGRRSHNGGRGGGKRAWRLRRRQRAQARGKVRTPQAERRKKTKNDRENIDKICGGTVEEQAKEIEAAATAEPSAPFPETQHAAKPRAMRSATRMVRQDVGAAVKKMVAATTTSLKNEKVGGVTANKKKKEQNA
eukprot:gene19203-6096_t